MRGVDTRLRTTDEISPPLYAGTIQSALTRRVTRDFEFSFDDIQDLDRLLSLAAHVSDPATRSRLESVVVDRLLARGSSAERLKLLFDDPRTVFSTVVAQQRKAIDEEVSAVEQLEFVGRAVEKNVSFITRPESIGAAVFLERLSGPISPFGVFQMLYEHHLNDRMLKKYLFQVRFAEQLASLAIHEELNIDPANVGWVVNDIEDLQQQILTMPDAIRYALVKHLFTGPEGILHSVQERKRLIKYFLSSLTHQEEQGTSLYQLLEQVGNEISEKADADLLFFMLLPLVVERIARPAQETVSWEEVLTSLKIPDDVAKAVDAEARNRRELQEKDPGRVFERKTTNLSRDTVTVLSDGTDVGSISVQILLEKIGESSKGQKSVEKVGHLTLNEFVVETCKNVGTLGTRFLQVLGYYIEGLTKEQEEAFRDVYDNTRSQNKLTAYETTKNRAPTYAASLERVDPPLGGGSLMTVYPVRLKNGEEEVMKILAPNAEHQLLAFVRTVRAVVAGLAEKDPEKYKMIPAVIDDLIAWIQADIHDEAFFEKDRTFKEAHHGFRPTGFEYGLYIPTAKPTGDGSTADKYVKREERVHGMTLNRLFAKPEGYDLRQIGAVIAKSFAQQLVTGVMHSDIHPGNYMVGEKDGQKWVYMIDRNFYLSLTPKEQALVLGLWNQSESMESRAQTLSAYFEEEGSVEAGSEFWNRVAEEMSTGDESSARRAVAQIREAGIKVPLNMTLLLKNVISLNRMCKTCGFASLVEAIGYMPE